MVRQLSSQRALTMSVLILIMGIILASAVNLSNAERGPYDRNWAIIHEQEYILIGVDPSIPPFGIWTAERPIGLDPAIAEAIAQELDLEPRFVLLTFDGLYDSLLLGHADMVIAALRPDPFREDSLKFSSTYFDAGQVVVSKSGTADIPHTLAVEFASEGDLAARELEGVQLQRYFTPEEVLQAVEADAVEAALVDRVSALLYLQAHPNSDLKLAAETFIHDPYVIAVRRTDWRLSLAIEAALADLKANGTLDRLISEWFAPNS